MKNWKVKLATSTVSFILDGRFQAIEKLVNKANAFYITDENVYALHQNKFKGKNDCHSSRRGTQTTSHCQFYN